MKSARAAIIVGIFLAIVVGCLLYLVSIAGRKGLGRSQSYLVHMTFPDASGLAKKSRVVISGIDIGKIEKIELVHGKAVVTIRVSDEFPLYEDASVLKRSESLLGDNLLDIDAGTEGKARIPNDGWINNVKTAPGMDQIMASMQHIANDVQKVTGSLASSVGTDEGKQDIANILKQLNETITQVNKATAMSAQQLAKILGNIEALSTDLRRLAPAQEQQIVAILANIRAITEQTRETIGVVHDVVGKETGQVDSALTKLNSTMDSAQKIASGIENGEGTVGKLLRDKTLADRIDHTVKGASDYIDRLTGLKLELNMRAELHFQPTKGGKWDYPTVEQIGAKIIPANSSRFVGFDLVSDSQGTISHAVSVQTINGAPLTTLTDNYAESLRVSAYLANSTGGRRCGASVSSRSTGGASAWISTSCRSGCRYTWTPSTSRQRTGATPGCVRPRSSRSSSTSISTRAPTISSTGRRPTPIRTASLRRAADRSWPAPGSTSPTTT